MDLDEVDRGSELAGSTAGIDADIQQALTGFRQGPEVEEVGTVTSVGRVIAWIRGLPHVKSDEVVTFAENKRGIVFNLDRDSVGIVLLDPGEQIMAGQEA